MMRDYKPPRSSYRRKARRPYGRHAKPAKRKLTFLLFFFGLATCTFIFFSESEITQISAHIPPEPLNMVSVPEEESSFKPQENKQTKQQNEPAPQPKFMLAEKKGIVKRGHTISHLLDDYLTSRQIYQVSQQSKKIYSLSKLNAGQPYKLVTLDDQFDSFLYDIDENEQLLILLQDDTFEISRIPIPYEINNEVVKGSISSNLFNAVDKIGEKPELAINLAEIFAWDIDFILDIRKGDSFQAIVEKRFREGKPAGYGRILAAEFINQAQKYQAVLYKDGNIKADYYDAEGNNLRKAFLKAPLSFTRISSGFTMKRFHPITRTWKSHPAIDYVAPTGTPIKTVGDGTVTRKGYTKGNGKFAEIRHTNGYSTIYLHMSRFARGLRKGKRVTQGQVIGYVGSTGLATGPHLCFRMRKQGRPVNPNRVRVPSAPAVSNQNMDDFLAIAAPLLAQLENEEIRQAKADISTETDSRKVN